MRMLLAVWMIIVIGIIICLVIGKEAWGSVNKTINNWKNRLNDQNDNDE